MRIAIRVVAPAFIALALLTGCSFVDVGRGGADAEPTPAATTPARPTPEEVGLIEFLRTTEGPDTELAAVSDEDLLTVTKDICDQVDAGTPLDDILLNWLEDDIFLTDATIVALFSGAQTTYCPDSFDTNDWVENSAVWKERSFLGYIQRNAGDWGRMADDTAIGMGHSVCQAFADGESVDTIVAAMHSGRPVGMAPDREGALAFVTAAVWAYCPDAA